MIRHQSNSEDCAITKLVTKTTGKVSVWTIVHEVAKHLRRQKGKFTWVGYCDSYWWSVNDCCTDSMTQEEYTLLLRVLNDKNFR